MKPEQPFFQPRRWAPLWLVSCKIAASAGLLLILFWGLARPARPGLARISRADAYGVLQATATLSVTLPTLAPTITPTATFLPLPAITFQPTRGAPTPALLSLERPGGSAPPKDRTAPGARFLRRWGLPLALAGLWIGLGVWLGGTLALLGRRKRDDRR